MGARSNIQWTDATWNIARGCTKVDSDCKFCYMYRDGARFKYDAKKVVQTKSVFNLPLRIKEPSKIFASSLTDYFHPGCDSFRFEAYKVIRRCPQHTFQILTKRPDRVPQFLPSDWGDGYKNVWMGTSIGAPEGMHRLHELVAIPSLVRFVSFEPLHEYIDLSKVQTELKSIHWAILGGESGNETGQYRYRPCEVEWMNDMVFWLRHAGVAIFVKQMGTHLASKLKMTDRHGTKINEFPELLQIREFPKS